MYLYKLYRPLSYPFRSLIKTSLPWHINPEVIRSEHNRPALAAQIWAARAVEHRVLGRAYGGRRQVERGDELGWRGVAAS